MNYQRSNNLLITKNAKFTLDYFFSIFSVFVFIFVLIKCQERGYELFFLLPFTFLLVYLIIFRKIVYNTDNIFLIIIFLIIFLRYIVLPLFTVITAYYDGRSSLPPKLDSFRLSNVLSIYELATVSIAIWYFEQKLRKYKNLQISIPVTIRRGSDQIYWLFIISTLFIGIIMPNTIKALNLVSPSSEIIRNFDSFTFFESLIIYSLLLAKQLFALLLIKKLYFKYLKNYRYRYLLFSVFLAVINIIIYFGTNRSDVIINAVATMLILHYLYLKRARMLLVIIIILLILIIISITVIRSGVSISNNSNPLIDFTDMLQAYLGGTYNIAIAIETKEMFPQVSSPLVLMYDILRPMIGINFIMKKLNIDYSNIYFNRRLWIGIDRRSQILPMIGQGYIYFGLFFAPILSVIFVKFSYYLYRTLKKTKSLEMKYFISLALIRLGFMMGQNTMNMINDISMNLFLFLIIFMVNRTISNGLNS